MTRIAPFGELFLAFIDFENPTYIYIGICHPSYMWYQLKNSITFLNKRTFPTKNKFRKNGKKQRNAQRSNR